MKKIIFVDDEQNILQGLKRTLRKYRSQWDMEFADSGASALEKLEEGGYDAIISDMRMPGMNGAELLETVKEAHPEMVRYILSGHSDQELIMRSVGPSHQYLAKPCDPDVLKTLLDRTFALRELLSSESLRTVVSDMSSLPSLPHIYRAVVEELQSEDASINSVGALIEQDPGMTMKILQLVNSAYFGMPRHISSPTEAANLLGMDIIKALVLSEGVFSQFEENIVKGLSLDTMRMKSLAIANIARDVVNATHKDKLLADQAYLAGSLSDLGSLVLATNMPDFYRQVLKLVRTDGCTVADAEHQMFGTTHAEVGAYVLALWGIDDDVVNAIAWQNDPEHAAFTGFNALTALVLARCLHQEQSCPNDYSEKIHAYIESVGLDEHMPVWKDKARTIDEDAA